MFARVVEVASAEDQFGTEGLHGLDLDRVSLLGHADDRADAEQAGGVGDRLAVVPGGGAGHSSTALVLGELGEQVDAAAYLERADRQMVFVLNPELGAGQRVEGRVSVKRRRREVRSDSLPGRQDVR